MISFVEKKLLSVANYFRGCNVPLPPGFFLVLCPYRLREAATITAYAKRARK